MGKRRTKPLDGAEREAIRELIRAGKPRNEIARETGRSPGTISNIARDAGLTFDRTATRAGTRARQDDNRARRAELEGLLIEDVHRLRRQMWEPAKVWDFTKDGDYVEAEHSEPTFGDKRAIAQSVAALIKSVGQLEQMAEGRTAGTPDWLAGAKDELRRLREGEP